MAKIRYRPSRTQCFLALLPLILTACVGTNPVRDIPDLAGASIGTVTAKLSEDVQPGKSWFEESDSFRHWRHQFEYCRTCYRRDLLHSAFFGAYRAFCAAKQGVFSYQPSVSHPSSVECRSSAGRLLFAVHAEVEMRTHQALGNTIYRWYVTADSFEPKDPGVAVQIHDEYAKIGNGYSKRNKDQERRDAESRMAQAKRDAERVERERAEADRQRLEAEKQRREQLALDQPKVKTIGQKICRTEQGMERRVVAYALGSPVYSDPKNRRFRITGFTEQVSGNRIKVLIGGIQVLGGGADTRGVDKLDGDVVLENGKSVWDDAERWQPCV